MQLKKVEIQGFKSFPDRTVITFSEGMTGIVGPNGSGKSNISDAIRWVMGETSARSLRGNKIEDVIFDGTASRKPLGFAEVSMTLSNADRTLDLPYDEVIITRRYYRSGDSEYFINGSAVRLRDIQELLRDTGLGKTGYSVISQGAITEVIEAKSSERRVLFEEAAGIASHRHKKEEALRKLDATRANLTRLNDILAELKNRLGPLERQSENAKKYLALRDEKRELEITLWVHRLSGIEADCKKAEERAELFARDLRRTEDDIRDYDAQIEESTRESERLTAEIEEIRTAVRGYEETRREKQTAAVVARNDMGHLQQDAERLAASATENEEEAARSEREHAEKEEEQAHVSEEIRVLAEKMDSIRSEIVRAEEAEAEASERISACESEEARRVDEKTRIQVRLGAIEQSVESGEQYMETRRREIEDAKKRAQELRAACLAAEEALKRTEEELASETNVRNGYLFKQKTLADRQEKNEAALQDLRMTLHEKQNRKNILTGMEAHYEGYQNSVRTVMEEARRGVLQGIEGTVADRISVSAEYSVAVETALGNSLQNVVTVDDRSAKNAIFLLKSRNAGRATFLPRSTVRGNVLSVSGLQNEEGFVGLAHTLVTCDEKYGEIVRSLLGRTAVAEDLDAATAIAAKYHHAFRLVTLDGQVVNAGGSLTGGSLNRNFGFLSRKNEIAALKKECENLQKEQERAEQTCRAGTAELAMLNADLLGVDAEIRNLEERRIKEQGDREHAVLSAADVAKQEEQLNIELETLAQTRERMTAERERLAEELKMRETEVLSAASETEQAQQALQAVRADKEKTVESYHAAKLELLEKQKDLESIRFALLQLEQRAWMRSSDTERLQQEAERCREQAEEKRRLAAALEEECKTVSVQTSEASARIQERIAARMVSEQKIQRLRAEEKDAYSLRESLVRQSEQQTAVLQKLAEEKDGIVSRIWEEYEYTLTEAERHCIEIEDFAAAEQKVSGIKNRMKALGNVNLDAVEEYREVKERHDELEAQVIDLQTACEETEHLIDGLTATMEKTFAQSFAVINETFGTVFRELFDGGNAELKLEDPEHVLESGIEIYAAPPGKIIKNLMALSGGERSLTAIALYFAILKIRPAPFCLLDEIEAALDDVNVVRYAEYLKRNDKTQFIVITHRRGTMEHADSLYGVTMKEKGISKILSVNVDEAEKSIREAK